jgi:hypothetical protein
MTYLAILISFLNAYLISRYARIKFALTLAGSFLLSAVAVAAYTSVAFNYNIMSSSFYWGFVIVFALLIFFLSNPLRYVIAWLFAVLIILLVAILPFDIKITSTISAIVAIAAAVPVFIFRKEIKWVLVGLMSGTNLALGVMILLFSLCPISSYSILSKISSLLYLCGAAAGIYFQFKLYDQYFLSKKNDDQQSV